MSTKLQIQSGTVVYYDDRPVKLLEDVIPERSQILVSTEDGTEKRVGKGDLYFFPQPPLNRHVVDKVNRAICDLVRCSDVGRDVGADATIANVDCQMAWKAPYTKTLVITTKVTFKVGI